MSNFPATKSTNGAAAARRPSKRNIARGAALVLLAGAVVAGFSMTGSAAGSMKQHATLHPVQPKAQQTHSQLPTDGGFIQTGRFTKQHPQVSVHKPSKPVAAPAQGLPQTSGSGSGNQPPSTQKGTTSPSGSPSGTLVKFTNQTGLEPGVWIAKIPSTWVLENCDNVKHPALPSVCSYTYGDQNTDVYYNPQDLGQRVTVTSCFGGGCSGWQKPIGSKNNQPDLPPEWLKWTVTSEVKLSRWEIAFHIDHNTFFGPSGLDGLTIETHMGSEATFPMGTMIVSLPASEHSLATAMLNSFEVFPPMSCGGGVPTKPAKHTK